MEEANSSNYNLIENELGFNVSQLDGHNFDVIVSTADYSLNLGVNSNNGTAKTPFSNQLTSTWMNDITSVRNCDQFGFVNNEMVIDASEGFTDKIDNDDFTSELNISHLNTGNRNGLNGSQADDTSNGQLISDDFAFSKAKHFDLLKEDTCSVSLKNGKASETLTKSDETDGFVNAFDQPLDSNILQMRKDRSRPVESAYFEIKKYRHSGLVSDDERENMNSVQTDDKFSSTNVASRKETKQLPSVTESDDNRITRTRKRRRFSTNFVDSSPVPSPEAEILSSSSITSNKYIRDEELITLDTKELNRRVKSLPKADVQKIKHRRRTLKNRSYARSCREKKNTETSTLQKTKGDLEKQFASTSFELQLEKLRRDDWKSKYEKLTSTLQQQGIQIQQQKCTQ